LKRSANLNFYLLSLLLLRILFESSPILVGDAVVGKSSFGLFFLLSTAVPAPDFLLFPLNGIRGNLTPFFLTPSLSYFFKGYFNLAVLFLDDCRDDYLFTPFFVVFKSPYKDEVSWGALFEPMDPLEETFLLITFETTFSNLFENVGFSPICFVLGLSPARFLVSSS